MSEITDKNVTDEVRQALLRLMRDSLELNDSHKVPRQKEFEDDIIEDFATVVEYIQLLKMKVRRYEPDTQEENHTRTH